MEKGLVLQLRNRVFSKAGYNVALIARNADYLNSFAEEIRADGGEAHPFPISNYAATSIKDAFAAIKTQWPASPLRVALFNTAYGRWKVCDLRFSTRYPLTFVMFRHVQQPFMEITTEEIQESIDTNIVAAFAFAHEVIAAFKALDADQGTGTRGTLLFTGASAAVQPTAINSVLAVGKFGLRALAQSLAKEFGKEDIHVAHVVVDGNIVTDLSRPFIPANKLEDPAGTLNPNSIGNARTS
ncbi:hypothetical protein HWV62_20210 [Athelia sp. TMB]|nr:hypothetical protein HWV62_20210 [Athelia sp. TMB]